MAVNNYEAGCHQKQCSGWAAHAFHLAYLADISEMSEFRSAFRLLLPFLKRSLLIRAVALQVILDVHTVDFSLAVFCVMLSCMFSDYGFATRQRLHRATGHHILPVRARPEARTKHTPYEVRNSRLTFWSATLASKSLKTSTYKSSEPYSDTT